MTTEDVLRVADRVRVNVETVIKGKDDVITTALVVLLSGGHLLLEDVPGVGKTLLSKALARSIDASVHRIQFTPDLMPSDVTGVSIFNPETRAFEFRPGPIFAHVVVADEINRASPKTQSALLECMEERQVTVDDHTYVLASPFMVVATQNPTDMAGTFGLPEAQRDRFSARVSMGYPDTDAEIAMLSTHGAGHGMDALRPVTDIDEVRSIIEFVARVHVALPVQQYAVSLSQATRNSPHLALGASPRATLQLVRTAQALAVLRGRNYVLPDDVRDLAATVLTHRLVLSSTATSSATAVRAVLDDLVAATPVPDAARA